MRIWKILGVIIILFLIVFVSLRVPFVQDLVIKTAVSNLATAESPFPEEDALSALICGSRSPLPSPGRAQTCVAVKAGEDIFIVDIGDGAAVNLGKYSVPINQVKAVLFLTSTLIIFQTWLTFIWELGCQVVHRHFLSMVLKERISLPQALKWHTN